MPDNNFSETLRNLDKEFNTNKSFGFDGIMGGATNQQQQQAQPQQLPPPPPPAPVSTDPTPQQLTDIMAPLNSALQSSISRFNTEISGLKQQLAQQPPPADGSIDPVQARINRIEQEQRDMTLQFARQQATAELKAAQVKFPDAGLTEKDIDDVWNPYQLDQKPDFARTIKWGEHFDVVGKAKENPVLRQRMATLEAERANWGRTGSDAIANMSSAPRTTQGAGLPSSQIFGELSDEDRIYAEADKIMSGASGQGSKARFLGFGRALGEAKRRLGFAS